MGMDDNKGGSVANDIERSVQKTKENVQTVKAVKSAVTKAAAGNYIGAAADVLKDEQSRTVILVAILTPILCIAILLTSVLYILPMAVYESIQNAVDAANTAYSQALYEGTSTGILGKISGIANGIGAWIKTLWDNLFHLNDEQAAVLDSSSREAYESSENNVFNSDFIQKDNELVSTAQQHIPSVLNKIAQVKTKYQARVMAIEEAITKSEASKQKKIILNGQGKFTKDLLEIKAYEDFEQTYDPDWDILKDTEWIPAYVQKELDSNEALHIALLYDVINDNDFIQNKITDFLKWLGYGISGKKGDTLYLNILQDSENGISPDVNEMPTLTGWTGTYMPQYLLDEARQKAEKAGELARAEKTQELIKSRKSNEKKQELIQEAYNEAYLDMFTEYCENYGVSFIDMMIYAYNGAFSVIEETGPEDNSKNLLVMDGSEIVSVQKYSRDHPLSGLPSYTYNDWAFAAGDYQRYGDNKHYNQFIKFKDKHDLTELTYHQIDVPENTGWSYIEAPEPDGLHVGYSKVKTSMREREYTTTVTMSIYYSNYTWYYKVDGKTYTSNPYASSQAGAAAFNSKYPGYTKRWGAGSNGTYILDYYNRPITNTVTITFEDKKIVQEPWIEAKFYKFYYLVTYNCPYYIAARSESEMMYISGLLEEDHIKEYLSFVDQYQSTNDSGEKGDNREVDESEVPAA